MLAKLVLKHNYLKEKFEAQFHFDLYALYSSISDKKPCYSPCYPDLYHEVCVTCLKGGIITVVKFIGSFRGWL